MGQRKARLAHAILNGTAVPPPVAPEMFEEETILLPKRVAQHVTKCLTRAKYEMTRSKYMAFLIEAACNHEDMLFEQQERASSLVVEATPQQTAQVALGGAYVGKRTGQ